MNSHSHVHPALAAAETPVPLGFIGHGAAQHPETVARWAVALADPLVSVEARAARTGAMTRFTERHTAWTAAFIAGVLHEMAQTLPSQDPWLATSACVDLNEIETGSPGRHLAPLGDAPALSRIQVQRGAPVPPTTGANRVDGKPFGTLHDVVDLIPVDLPDPASDIGVTAVAGAPLSRLAAALVSMSSEDPATVQSTLRAIQHALWLGEVRGVVERPAETFLRTATDALRWLAFRRRTYLGDDDGYLLIVLLGWISSAERVVAGAPIDGEIGIAAFGKIRP